MTDLLKRFLEKRWTPYPNPKTQQENIINWLAYLIRDLALEVQEAMKLAREARDKVKDMGCYSPPSKPPSESQIWRRDFLILMDKEKQRLGEERYHEILSRHGYKEASEIYDLDEAVKVYEEIVKERPADNI